MASEHLDQLVNNERQKGVLTEPQQGYQQQGTQGFQQQGRQQGIHPILKQGQRQHVIFADDQPQEDASCSQWCWTEFSSDNIMLDYDVPAHFVTSQWTVKWYIYIIYRILVAIALVSWVAGDILYETNTFYKGQGWRWFVFASNWSFALLALSAVYQAVTAVIYVFKPYWIMDPLYIRAMPTVLKVQWLLNNMAINSAIVVTAAYWLFIAFVSDSPMLTSNMSRLKHTVNSLYVIVDLMIVAMPVRVYHMFFTIFLGSLYTVFNALYYINNGSLMLKAGEHHDGRAYYFMNWTLPVEAICTCVLGVMLSALTQILLHCIFLTRRYIYRSIYPGVQKLDSELQNIIANSSSYNSIDDIYGDKKFGS